MTLSIKNLVRQITRPFKPIPKLENGSAEFAYSRIEAYEKKLSKMKFSELLTESKISRLEAVRNKLNCDDLRHEALKSFLHDLDINFYS